MCLKSGVLESIYKDVYAALKGTGIDSSLILITRDIDRAYTCNNYELYAYHLSTTALLLDWSRSLIFTRPRTELLCIRYRNPPTLPLYRFLLPYLFWYTLIFYTTP